mmetsp:Transcript_19582/g.35938  ORF Transcript_19582/g.35938 Transcript_19582/m.35938 type:complete len:416 (-) Transcript_19582:1847-3094(-)
MAEEIDPETLASVLKERTKELKLSAKRLQKLEERYVVKHREHADLLSDRTVFVNFMSIMFPDQEFNYNYGNVTLDRLEMLYHGKEEEHRRVLQQTNQMFNEEISKLKGKLSTLQEDLKAKELELKELNALHAEVNRLQALNVELRGELEFADKQLEDFKVENAKMKSQQNEFAKYRANSLLAALESKTDSGDDKTSQLQTQLAEANVRIQELKARLKGYEENGRTTSRDSEMAQNVLLEVAVQKQTYEERLSEMEKQLSSAQHEFVEHRRRAQKLMMEKDIQIDKLKSKLHQANLDSEDSFSRSRIIEVEPPQADVNMEYLKNIVLKFMEYIYAGYTREAQTLAGVIFTVMDFSPEEIELVRKAREEKGVINSVTGLFAVKSPGTGVSYNTLHTNEGRRRANLPPLGESSRIENS